MQLPFWPSVMSRGTVGVVTYHSVQVHSNSTLMTFFTALDPALLLYNIVIGLHQLLQDCDSTLLTHSLFNKDHLTRTDHESKV